jgi:predicted permease
MTFDIKIVLDIAISMFLVMLVGYFLRKFGIIDAKVSKSLSRLVLYLTQPVLIVMSMIKMTFSVETTKQLGIILLVSLGVHTFAAVFGYFSMRFIKDENARKLSEHSIIFSNVMFFGLPIVQSLFGDRGIAWASFFSVIFHVFAWTYGMIILGRGRDDIKLSVKKVLLNFGTIPCFIGIVLYFISGLNIPQEFLSGLSGLKKALDYLGGLCTPISLLVLGGVLTTLPLKKLFNNWKIYYVCFMKLVVFPLITYAVAKFILNIGDEMSMFTLIMAGLPTASLTNMFAELYDIEPGYAATSVGMTTVFSVATLPFVVWIAQLL